MENVSKKEKVRRERTALDRIIDKYTATPDFDPEVLNYSLRPSKIDEAETAFARRGARNVAAVFRLLPPNS